MSLFPRRRRPPEPDPARQIGDAARARLRTRPLVAPPAPWGVTGGASVGGLTEIGYGPDSDLLLVVSSNGRGVFDVLTGERVTRDDSPDWDGLDQTAMRCPGIGPLDGVTVPLAGLHGGGLPRGSGDGWLLTVEAIDWPNHHAFLEDGHRGGPYVSPHEGGGLLIWQDSPCEYRAGGFSPTGRSFALASSCEVTLFARTD